MSKLYVSNEDESVRMFKSDFLEIFTKVHWTVPLYIFIPVILYMVYKSVEIGISFPIFIGIIVSGLFIWTLTEYLLHRFLFHYHPKNEKIKRFFWTFHGVHHDYPQDSRRLVMPPSISIPISFLFYLLFKLIVGPYLIYPFYIGFIGGYLFYDITHYAIHHFNFKGNIWKKLKDHHS
ncbi:MAG: sterol desaturase family protein, partial [Melioribacteraceae bacterium]|nr:sterol desaturase family protein [Melioribacteraceae bacterium]